MKMEWVKEGRQAGEGKVKRQRTKSDNDRYHIDICVPSRTDRWRSHISYVVVIISDLWLEIYAPDGPYLAGDTVPASCVVNGQEAVLANVTVEWRYSSAVTISDDVRNRYVRHAYMYIMYCILQNYPMAPKCWEACRLLLIYRSTRFNLLHVL